MEDYRITPPDLLVSNITQSHENYFNTRGTNKEAFAGIWKVGMFFHFFIFFLVAV